MKYGDSVEKKTRTILGAMLIATVLAGWAGGPFTTSEQYTYGGGALGAGTGAIIGVASGSPATGVVIGGPLGAIVGYLIGDSLCRALDASVAKKSRGGSFSEADSGSGEVVQR